MRYLLCPANPTCNDPLLPCVTHYVGVAGVGADAATLPLSDPRAGVFGYDRKTSLRDIKDGHSTTMLLTEVLSNNAVAALMAPIALGIAHELGVDARPFIIAVTFAASAAFATPIGYQTNTYVYGIGGYKFGDFLKIGIPLNALCFAVAMIVIPRVWHF